jgi:hypothetical protein
MSTKHHDVNHGVAGAAAPAPVAARPKTLRTTVTPPPLMVARVGRMIATGGIGIAAERLGLSKLAVASVALREPVLTTTVSHITLRFQEIDAGQHAPDDDADEPTVATTNGGVRS